MTIDKLPESVSQESPEIKYGERDIAEGKLITFPNPRVGGAIWH